ncbi:hypothetical protein CK203_089442 [Vitis vinifera]|uniref:Uncharacterized protein n=1 Tax=Vitis vinifera TaxID=29760 RepID=A0A438E9A6_VITVI|nr:hypothetical protein CK203_089442 [Vitis vinifera]
MEASSGMEKSPAVGKGKIASGYGLEAQTSSPAKKKRRSVQKSCGLSFSLQALSADKAFGVAANLLSEKDKVVFDVNPEGSGSIAWGKGFDITKRSGPHNLFSDDYRKDFWAEWGPILVAEQSWCCLLLKNQSPAAPTLPRSVIQSLNPLENREKSEFFDIKDDDGTVGQNSVGFPNLVVEVNQIAHPTSQMTDSVNPVMPNTNPSPIQTTVSQRVVCGFPNRRVPNRRNFS